jgi:signal transduction histidine kinase
LAKRRSPSGTSTSERRRRRRTAPASVAAVRSRTARARLELVDDGPSLDPSTAGALFEPFAAPRGSGPAAGAGVSMAIARRIAERHGGSAWAHTGRRDGCTIVVELPEAV